LTNVDRAKLVFAVLGLAIFLYGMYVENERLRWLAIGVLFLAFILRFLRTPDRRE
jgi:drug/metabolite transporter (DMT)-like permease